MLWLLLIACPDASPVGSDADTHEPVAADTADACDLYTWETAGAPFILTWCTPCHGSALTPAQRQGAPPGIDLDDEADTLALAARVLARAAGPSPDMPPTGGPTADDRALVSAWLACATP